MQEVYYNRAIYYRTVTQNALDAAILAGVGVADPQKSIFEQTTAVKAEAEKIFAANTESITDAVSFSVLNIAPEGEGIWRANVDVGLNYLFAANFTNEELLRDHSLTAKAQMGSKEALPLELVLLVDVGLHTSSLSSLQANIQTMLEELYKQHKAEDELIVSVIPYSDAVYFPQLDHGGSAGDSAYQPISSGRLYLDIQSPARLAELKQI